MDRRASIQWMLAAAASMPLLQQRVWAEAAAPAAAMGYGGDPDLKKVYHPGDLWPLTLSRAQRITAAALSDVIIPTDSISPSASSVGVVEFLDEWVSAPYPRQQQDRPVILEGLVWINAEATRRFDKEFAALNELQQRAICDDICDVEKAKPEFKTAAAFFARYRDLTAGGFYTTPQGTNDLKYIGNVPLAKFDGPPPEVLRKIGVGPVPSH